MFVFDRTCYSESSTIFKTFGEVDRYCTRENNIQGGYGYLIPVRADCLSGKIIASVSECNLNSKNHA